MISQDVCQCSVLVFQRPETSKLEDVSSEDFSAGGKKSVDVRKSMTF